MRDRQTDNRYAFLSSVGITFLIGIIVSFVSGFKFVYAGKDDYVMSLLLMEGDSHSLFLNWFLSFPLTKLQQFFPFINWFGLSQEINCFVSLVLLNFVILNKKVPVVSYVFSIVVSVIVFTTSVLVATWTHTTTVMCTAGIVLLLYALLVEKRIKYKRLQVIISIIWLLLESLYRFDATLVCFGFTAILVVCFFVCCFVYNKKNGNPIKLAAKASVKKYSQVAIALFCSFGVCLLFNVASAIINYSSDNYANYVDFNNGRVKVTDYKLAPYEGNEEFYKQNDVLSVEDFEMLKAHRIDKDVYTAQKLNAIGDYSSNIFTGTSTRPVFAIKQNIKLINKKLISIKNALPFYVSKTVFYLSLIGCFVLFVVLCVIILRFLFKSHFRSFNTIIRLLPSVCLSLLWILYFWLFEINSNTVLFILVAAFITITSFIGNRYYWTLCAVLSVTIMLLNCYQSCFRTSFRVTYTFIIPTFVFLIFSLSQSTIRKRISDKTSYSAFVAVGLLIATIPVEIILWQTIFIPTTGVYSRGLEDYVRNNKSITYVHLTNINRKIDKNFSCPYKVPDVPNNSVNYGGWNISSSGYDRELNDKGIDVLFEDLINNNYMRLILENDDNNSDIKNQYEVYYNNHYADNPSVIILEKEDEIEISSKYWDSSEDVSSLAIYRVIKR